MPQSESPCTDPTYISYFSGTVDYAVESYGSGALSLDTGDSAEESSAPGTGSGTYGWDDYNNDNVYGSSNSGVSQTPYGDQLYGGMGMSSNSSI